MMKRECSLNSECLTRKIICRTNDTNSDKKLYFDLANAPFKLKYRNHTRGSKHQKYEKKPDLTKDVWQLKLTSINSSVTFSRVTKVRVIPNSNICQ